MLKVRNHFVFALVGSIALSAIVSCGSESEVPFELNQKGSETEAKTSAQLVGSGMYEVASVKGHTIIRSSSKVTEQAVGKSFSAGNAPLVQLNFNGKSLTLKGGSTCNLILPNSTSLPATDSGAKAGRTLNGIFSAIQVFGSIASNFNCKPNEIKVKEEFFAEKGNLFEIFGVEASLGATFGVFGEPKNTKAVEQECKSLANMKVYSNLSKTDFCFGKDKDSNLKMLIRRPGEFYVQRIILRKTNLTFENL